MITDTTTGADALVALAAATAATHLAGGEPLTPGPSSREAGAPAGGSAVLAAFTGSSSGELLVGVDADLTAALRDSPLGELDLAAALSPAVEAVAAAIGPVVLGPLQVVDAAAGLARVLGAADAAVVPLTAATGVRAVVALSVTAANRATRAAAPVFAPVGAETLQAQRLDLLRGVEMEATAELGRARMTVNDLLSLRSGAVIELDRAAGAPADLYVNGRLIARAEVVVVDENYGLRITEVVTDSQAR